MGIAPGGIWGAVSSFKTSSTSISPVFCISCVGTSVGVVIGSDCTTGSNSTDSVLNFRC